MVDMQHTPGLTKNPAIVFGLSETGLGVGRSLGRLGICVFGFDFKKDLAYYSKYMKPVLCPHPLESQDRFVDFLVSFCSAQADRPVLFITSDSFLQVVSHYRGRLEPHCLFNLPTVELIEAISDKYRQYQLVKAAGIALPETHMIESSEQLEALKDTLTYPVFVKGVDVSSWRTNVDGRIKGFGVRNRAEFMEKIVPILKNGVKVIAQEIVEGPDTNNYKYCTYFSRDGVSLLGFTLRKIRQNPIRFGVGAVIESIEYPELASAGDRLFRAIGYQGVGSAEFKLDRRDGRLKLIEINPRYWQQNALPSACGMNFPLVDYLECTGQHPPRIGDFATGVKWVNRYLDFESFLEYRKEGELTFRKWRGSLKGRKIYSDYDPDDRKPALYPWRPEKLFKIPRYLFERLF